MTWFRGNRPGPLTHNTVRQTTASGFTLLELLIVIGIIAVLAALLIPSMGSSSGRALDAATRQFAADLENARLIALAQRTKTRVLIAATNDSNWGENTAWRAYVVAKFDTTASPPKWVMHGKVNRILQSVTFDSRQPSPTPTATPPPVYIVPLRMQSITAIAKAANAQSTTDFTGPYVEFRASGAVSLDPNQGDETINLQDGFVPAGGSTPVPKNVKLRSEVSIDPLTGAVLIK